MYVTDPDDLGTLFPDEPSYRTDQLTEWLYTHPVLSADDMTNLPKPMRDQIAKRHWPFKLDVEQSADDGLTKKWLFRCGDGSPIETVLMGYPTRTTLCISSQVGCAMGCTFCATGQFGFERHLNAGEIVTIVYVNTDQKICTLDRALSICRSLKLGLMLDVKIQRDEKFFQKIVTLIKKHGYENSSITINGDPDLRRHLKEIALLTVTQDEFKKVRQGLSCDLRNKFWFGLPPGLSSEMVKPLQLNGAYVIPAINTFRYPAERHYELARKDIQRLSDAGVDGFQIDSDYKPLFLEKRKKSSS